jgi:hypothetical protein
MNGKTERVVEGEREGGLNGNLLPFSLYTTCSSTFLRVKGLEAGTERFEMGAKITSCR